MTQDSHDEKRRKHMAVMDDKRKIPELIADLDTSTTLTIEEAIKKLRGMDGNHDGLGGVGFFGETAYLLEGLYLTGLAAYAREADAGQLRAKLDKAVAALTAIGNAKTSGGGQASVMAFHAREALAEIKGE